MVADNRSKSCIAMEIGVIIIIIISRSVDSTTSNSKNNRSTNQGNGLIHEVRLGMILPIRFYAARQGHKERLGCVFGVECGMGFNPRIQLRGIF